MARPLNRLDLQAWDREATSKSADYEKLYRQMLQASKESPNLEIWWRLALIAYQASLNILDDDAIAAKTKEAYQYAEKAVQLEPGHFNANLWLANSAGKLALLETDLQLKLNWLIIFLRSIGICIQQNPNDPLVLFMEGRLQLALVMMSEEEKAMLQQNNITLPVDTAAAEAKLRKSIQLDSTLLDNYFVLASLLIKDQIYAEAKQVIERGLFVQRFTKSDEVAAEELKKMKDELDGAHL